MNITARPDLPTSDLDSEALDWFVRGGRGLDEGEQTEFAAWIAGDAARVDAVARWQGDWQVLDHLPATAIEQLRQQLASDKAAAASLGARMKSEAANFFEHIWKLAPRPAMAAAALCLSAACYLAFNHWQQQPVFEHSYATQRGQQLEITLPDGSRMRLDTATSVEVTFYRKHREVRLPEGQVVFQVKGDAARPFHVLAGPVRVTVVGTRFAVRNTPDVPGNEGVRVAVEEGHVRVAGLDGQELRNLTAGQQVASDATGLLGAVASVDATGIAPWRDGRITFDNTPLVQALAELERYGHTGLIVRDEQVAALRLTGTFDPRRPANFMLALPKVLPVKLQPRGSSIEIAPGS